MKIKEDAILIHWMGKNEERIMISTAGEDTGNTAEVFVSTTLETNLET